MFLDLIACLYDGYLQESLDALNNRLKEPIPINRFRPKYVSVVRMRYLIDCIIHSLLLSSLHLTVF